MEDKTIRKLEQRIARLEQAVFGDGRKPTPKQSATSRTAGDSPRSLPGHILQLRDGGFFKQSKTITDVHKKLNPTYECEFDRVAMALLRLLRRKQLRKTSKKVGKRQQLAYVW
jgi:hypothetical protein